ncbi:helix-turn-helix transcriptional regulator [Bacillus suaedaesalsae]|uniref:Helix-turn-helix domain-containing protein n=1 Tax=Bacillus suaedaesalsae TaxID=2810349 RepID=A0ABS2DGG4_9BACI|nr:AraC family transcriptional regulator [Bacillus suaedaesalsae]MBM6617115.1 helix-turn-helix domain-containing protein [Bacillus suaedaesalsae]
MSYISFYLPPFPTFIKGGEAVFTKGNKHIRRTYTVFDLLYVLEGEIHITEHESRFTVQEGQYVILVPGLEHYGHKGCEGETRYVWLHFNIEHQYDVVPKQPLDWTKLSIREGDFEEAARFNFYIPQYNSITQRELLEQLLKQLTVLESEQSPDHKLRQQIIFQDILLLLQKQALQIPSATEKVSEEVLKYIRGNYQKPIKMADISANLHFNPDYITRCVQKTIGTSPSQYLNQYRIVKAKSRLATTNDKISSVCKDVGIEDQGYFSKLFRKMEGMSPGEYRRIVHRTEEDIE